jgi:quercetin dioxygenase-like cupin family protein
VDTPDRVPLADPLPGEALVGLVVGAETVLACSELSATIQFFTTRLGFRVESIHPADHPVEARLTGHGLSVRLRPGPPEAAGRLRLLLDPVPSDVPSELVAPNGTVIEFAPARSPLTIPPLPEHGLSITRFDRSDADAWGVGRAGMQYRDLLPGRLDGRFIASHIRIPGGGPVPDYVHYHDVRFQMIYCAHGWTRLVYEDQGEPFVLHAGDCVLQPPLIRHRVLESGDDLEVIEIGCPAVHETYGEHGFDLPTGVVDPSRDFSGQRFVRHIAAEASWNPWRADGFECRDIGFAAATDGLAEARVVRPTGPGTSANWAHDAEFVFGVVLGGAADLECAGEPTHRLGRGDAVLIPRGVAHRWTSPSAEFELLDVTLPAVPPSVA